MMADDTGEQRIEPVPLEDYEWNDDASPKELAEALEAGQPRIAQTLTEARLEDLEESGRALPHTTAKAVLQTLRQYTMFDTMEAVAAAIRKNEPGSLIAGRQHAQALIEAKKCTQAISVLTELEQRATADAEGKDLTAKKLAQQELP